MCMYTQTYTRKWQATTQTHIVNRPLLDLIEGIRCYPITSQAISAYIQKYCLRILRLQQPPTQQSSFLGNNSKTLYDNLSNNPPNMFSKYMQKWKIQMIFKMCNMNAQISLQMTWKSCFVDGLLQINLIKCWFRIVHVLNFCNLLFFIRINEGLILKHTLSLIY